MKANFYTLGNFAIKSPLDWVDVTDDIGHSSPPFTLAKSDGFGVLQFTFAAHSSGVKPDVTIERLRELQRDFAESRELADGFDAKEMTSKILTCAMSYKLSGDFIRVWYCSDGTNVVLATYLCRNGSQDQELADCEGIITELSFKAPTI